MTSPLEDRLRRLIRTGGPMPVSDYMAACLFDPEHGYYASREPFGRDGDFTTAPEISQMFGEIVGAWLIHAWSLIGRPDPFVLAEMGPGRGTLMADILRTARHDPAFLGAARVHLVETSDRLQAAQRDTLTAAGVSIEWHRDLDGLPALPLLLVANELFDAIPIRQFQKTTEGWCERRIGLAATDESFEFVAGPPISDLSILPDDATGAPTGTVCEYAPAREAIATRVADHLVAHDGAALLVDYGSLVPATGDTLQAVRDHRFAPVLEAPGLADLTSHVDFAALASAAATAGATVLPGMTQGEFLLALGLIERAGALGHGKDEATQESIRDAVERLAAPGKTQMGTLFKVMCMTGRRRVLPPFADADEAGH